ncbi:hypothetical protein pdam_00004729 [Pocillopora damicornis]|uniref:Uncharacterized protein n=1 Tax=Pocillopora damicornis TaxID=46731 RepID=A0A3M6UE58_POCDA|nr:hypothetical protein pdam_00004729 [Pocillopora damicornis]
MSEKLLTLKRSGYPPEASEYTVTNSAHFVPTVSNETILDNEIRVSFDVESLFTDVRIDAAVKEAIQMRLHPDNINRDSGIEIIEAWMPTIKKHNNRRAVRQRTAEGTNHWLEDFVSSDSLSGSQECNPIAIEICTSKVAE